ncbi:MAG: pre-peptidase C-terminal domain-containing protein [Thermoplasmata archaeon]
MEPRKRKGRMVAGVAGAVIAMLAISMLFSVVSVRIGSADDVDTDLALNTTLSGSLSGAGKKDYYKIVVNGGTKLVVKVDGPNTSGVDFDLYIKKDAKPTTTSYDARGYTSSSDEQVTVTNPSGTYYVMVYAYKGSGSYTITATVEGSNGGNGGGNGGNTNEPVELTSGVAKTGSLDATNTKAYYKITVSTGTALKVVLDGPNGADFDLYVKKGALPTTSSYDARGYTNSADEQVSITNPAGTYYIMVNRYSGSGSYTITATVETGNSGGNGGGNGGNTNEPVELTSGVAKTGSLDATNTKAYYKITVSTGTALRVVLDGPNGADFDLYVKKGALPTTSSYDARGYTNSADEQVTISNPAGTYYIMVNRYSGSGSYTITATVESGSGGSNNTLAKWTIMIYECVDDEGDGNGTGGLRSARPDIESVGSHSSVNIIMLEDLYGPNNSKVWKINYRNSTLVRDLGEVSTGSKQTLIDFINLCKNQFPAQRYALVLSGHSVSALWGFGYDDTPNGGPAYLSVKDTYEAIVSTGVHFNLFVASTCVWGDIEIIYQFRTVADIMVGSQEVSYGFIHKTGWASLLKSNPDATAYEIAKRMVDDYYSYTWWDDGVTAAVYDLTKAATLKEKVAIFSDRLKNAYNTYREEIQSARAATEHMEGTEHVNLTGYIDLYDFAMKVKAKVNSTEIQNAAQAVMDAVRAVTLYEKHSTTGKNANVHGVNIYFKTPYSGAGRITPQMYASIPIFFIQETSWASFVLLAQN